MTSDDLCEENVIKKKIEKKYDGSSSRSLFSIILSMNTFIMIIDTHHQCKLASVAHVCADVVVSDSLCSRLSSDL